MRFCLFCSHAKCRLQCYKYYISTFVIAWLWIISHTRFMFIINRTRIDITNVSFDAFQCKKKIASSSISIIYSLSLRRINTSVNIEINTDLCACFHNRKNSRTSTDARSVYEYIQHRKNRNKSGSGWTTQKKKQNSNKHE